MKKLAVLVIFSFLIMLSLQQTVFAEIEGEEERKKAAEEAVNAMKREISDKNEEDKIEAEEVKEKEERKKVSELIKLLPTEDKLEEITFRTIWQYADKQSNLDEEVGIETTTAILRDITRVFDPIVNKYKVSTILVEIIKYDDIYELEYYWEEVSSSSIENIFNNAYLIGSPTENIDCMFNFSEEGAVTLCITDEYVVQSIIHDKYQEHFGYNKLKIGPKKLQINQDEMTINIVQDVLKNIEKKKGIESNYQLFKILESNKEIREKDFRDREVLAAEDKKRTEQESNIINEQNKNKALGMEKDKKYGIQNFSCVKDEFGLVTISGQFNNNQIKKDKVIVEILFFDKEQNIILKNTANLLDIDQFETKRFLGNTKIDQSFLACKIQVVN